MGFRFRKSFGKGPFRVTISKSGVNYSVGAGGFGFTGSTKKRVRKAGSGNIFKWSGYLFGGCLIFYLLVEYWYVFLTLAAIGGSIWGILEIDKRRKQKTEPEQIAENVHNFESSSQYAAEQQEKAIASAIEERRAAFDAALSEIPKVEVKISDPVPRQRLKDMPQYNFTNITRTTRLGSIFPLVFLDVETTGFYPLKNEIIEVSAIKFDVGMTPVACFSTLCHPKSPIPADATAINNITDEMVCDAPNFAQIAPALDDFICGCNIAGHNIDFDLRFIFAHGAQFPKNVKVYDTLDLAHLTIKKSEISGGYGLDSLCYYYGIWRANSHRSLSDCYATSKVFARIVQDKTERDLTKEL